jgi:hypothetical protein
VEAVAAIAAALKADATVAGIVAGRVTDHDIRRSGWEASPTFFDGDGVIRPTLMVDDSGAVRPPFGHPAERLATVYVWGFAPDTPAGRASLATLMTRVEVLLHRWQVPDTGALALPAARLGQQRDDAGAIFDRITVALSGVLAVTDF